MAELTFRGVELRPTDNAMRFWIIEGYDNSPEFRGEDDVIPQAAGRDEGAWIKDVRPITLHGYIRGIGADEAAVRQSYRAAVNTLKGALENGNEPGRGNMIVYAPLLGLTTGQTATIRCRYVGGDWNYHIVGMAAEVRLRFVSVSSPPDWTVA